MPIDLAIPTTRRIETPSKISLSIGDRKNAILPNARTLDTEVSVTFPSEFKSNASRSSELDDRRKTTSPSDRRSQSAACPGIDPWSNR